MTKIIGIDFGTSNTFCCYAEETNQTDLRSVPIKLQDHHESFPTITVYKRDDAGKLNVYAVGAVAEEEWLQIPTEDYGKYLFVANFKPDLAVSPDSYEHAKVFLRELAKELFDNSKLKGTILSPDQQTIIGVPAKTLARHADLTISAAREAGFKRVETVAEPIGALVYHLNARELVFENLRSSVLVIDFGGGTCDFAYLVRGKCEHAWGDPVYGGRLFDDLFFQWFCEANPDASNSMASAGDERYVHWHCCRQAKEAFSRAVARNRNIEFSFANFLGHGRFRDITWQQFCDRAEHYTPSAAFLDMLNTLGGAYHRFTNGTQFDLISHFESTLRAGLQENSIGIADIDFVILTGGSSLWPLVTDVLLQHFHIPREKIKQSSDPQATIGSGLALHSLIKNRAKSTQEALVFEKPDKLKELKDRLSKKTQTFVKKLSAELVERLCTECLDVVLTVYKNMEVRWSIAELEDAINREVKQFQPTIDQLVCTRQEELSASLTATIADFVREWLSSYHIRRDDRFEIGHKQVVPGATELSAADGIVMCVAAIVAVITATIVATLCGGAGTALILAGPAGLVIGAIVGAAISVLAMWYGWDHAKEIVKNIPIPAFVRRKIMSDRVSDKQKDAMKTQLKEKLLENIQKEQDKVLGRIDDLLQQAVERIDWIHLL